MDAATNFSVRNEIDASSMKVSGTDVTLQLGCAQITNSAVVAGIPDVAVGPIAFNLVNIDTFNPPLIKGTGATTGQLQVLRSGVYRITWGMNTATTVLGATLGPAASFYTLGHRQTIFINGAGIAPGIGFSSDTGTDATAITTGAASISSNSSSTVTLLTAGDTIDLRFDNVPFTNVTQGGNIDHSIPGAGLGFLRVEALNFT